MKQLFPEMYDRPDKWMPVPAMAYWIFAFLILPTWLPLIADGLFNDLVGASWVDIALHIINALVVFAMYRSYAVESFLNVQLDTKKFFIAVGGASLIAVCLSVWMYFFSVGEVWDAYPINELTLLITPGLLVDTMPLFGTLCHVLITPIVVVGLFYVPVFAPMCCRRTWLGYLMVSLALLVPVISDILYRDTMELLSGMYLLQLPIHLLACWSYQKADSVWAPLATLSIFNLVTSLPNIFL